MPKKLRDAMRRFLKLYNERKGYAGDVGWVSISEELVGVGLEIRQLTKAMIEELDNGGS